MSTVINANNGGSGSFNLSRPLLHVTAPVDSIVSFIFDGFPERTILAEKAKIDAQGNIAHYFYSPKVMGTWEIYAVSGNNSESVTVEATHRYEYDISINYSE